MISLEPNPNAMVKEAKIDPIIKNKLLVMISVSNPMWFKVIIDTIIANITNNNWLISLDPLTSMAFRMDLRPFFK